MFRTQINTTSYSHPITHQDKILLLGSCFADSVGKRLLESKFNALVNPFGVLYNPSSIAHLLKRVETKNYFVEQDWFKHRELWCNLFLHGSFSNPLLKKAMAHANEWIDTTHQFLQHTNYLIITWGTAYVYSSINSGEIVANCHKLPAKKFKKHRLSVGDIVEEWTPLLLALQKNNPNIRIILTTSPIRHRSDGEHENQLSKSTLFLAEDQLMTSFDNINYFPAYEIMMDDLRDYRFYEADMIHPSTVAVDYIYEHFCKHWITEDARTMMIEIKKIKQALAHQPFNPEQADYKNFLRTQHNMISQLVNKYPYLNFEDELRLLIHDT